MPRTYAEAKTRAALKSFRPDATFAMRKTEGNLDSGGVRSGIYIVTLHDLAQRRDIWNATAELNAGSTLFVDRAQAGEAFAAEVVKQMASDDAPKSCPPQAATPA